MQSFSKKYEGREQEILNYINEECGGDKYGSKVMEHFKAKDYIAWRNYVDKIAQKFGFKFLERQHCSIAEHLKAPDIRLSQKYSRKVSVLKLKARLEAEDKRLDKEIEELRRQILLGEMAWNVEGDYESSDLRL